MSTAIVKADDISTALAPSSPAGKRTFWQTLAMRCTKTGRAILAEEAFQQGAEQEVNAGISLSKSPKRTFVNQNSLYDLEQDYSGEVIKYYLERCDTLAAARYTDLVRREGKPTVAQANAALEYTFYFDTHAFLHDDSNPHRQYYPGKGHFGTRFYKLAEAALDAGACPDTENLSFTAAMAGDTQFLDLLMKHGANKTLALNGAIQGGHTQLVRQLLTDGATIIPAMHAHAAQKHFTDIAEILRNEEEIRKTEKFTGAVTAEAAGNEDVVIKPENGTFRLDINDCTMYGDRDDLKSFIQDQREIFRITQKFNTWAKPMPDEALALVSAIIHGAEQRLSGKIAVYYGNEEVPNHLPFVRAQFDRATQKIDYKYLIPGMVGEGVLREDARFYKKGLQELAAPPEKDFDARLAEAEAANDPAPSSPRLRV